MAGSKDPRGEGPKSKNRAHGRSPAPPSRPGRGLRSAPMRWCRSAGFTTARKLGLTGGLPGVTAGRAGVRGRQLRWFKRDPGTR